MFIIHGKLYCPYLFYCMHQALGAEQRAKQLQEELKCQRQNSESIRVQHQQRTKELERQHQRVHTCR